MKILFFSDNYGDNIMSLKRIIREELVRRGVDVVYRDKADVEHVVELAKAVKPDQIWLVHSSLVLPCDKNLLEPPVIGFGFSDPHYFSPTRLESYDVYMTAYYDTYLKYKDVIPVLHSPDSYDPHTYTDLGLERDIDATCIGSAIHPRFPNANERVEVINRLRAETNLNIHAYGHGWPAHAKNHGYIAGDALVDIISRSKIGLDIQGGEYSFSERVLHYSGCATPVITRGCIDVRKAFAAGAEILTYDSYESLREQLMYSSGQPRELRRIGLAVQARCLKDHTVSRRVGDMLAFIEENVK